jgi:hypothetical protein
MVTRHKSKFEEEESYHKECYEAISDRKPSFPPSYP